MMKKMLVCLMIAVLLMLSAASALEGFTLRNGVQFGDTIEQIREKETLVLKDPVTRFDFTTFTSLTALWTQKGTVAGIDGVEIGYLFDRSKKLAEVQWKLPANESAGTSDSRYSALYNAMVIKYGAPLACSNGTHFAITGIAIDQAYGPLRNCAEWVHDCGDGHYVKIELVQFNDGERAAQPTFSIHVGYTYFTDAQLKESPHQMEQDDASILSDI